MHLLVHSKAKQFQEPHLSLLSCLKKKFDFFNGNKITHKRSWLHRENSKKRTVNRQLEKVNKSK